MTIEISVAKELKSLRLKISELELSLDTATDRISDLETTIGNLVSDLATLTVTVESLGTMSGVNHTVSTDDPSGGEDGDLWFKYEE